MYAQILKETMIVNLVGGEEVGLPIEHPLVLCVNLDTHSQKNEVEIGMIYDEDTDSFTVPSAPKIKPEADITTEPTLEERIIDLQITTEYQTCLLEIGME